MDGKNDQVGMLEAAQIAKVWCPERFGDACNGVVVAYDENGASCVTTHGRNDTVDVLGNRAAQADDFGRDAAALGERRCGFEVPLPFGGEDHVDPGVLELACERIGANEPSGAEVGILRILCRLLRVADDVDDRLAVSSFRRSGSWRRGGRAAGKEDYRESAKRALCQNAEWVT